MHNLGQIESLATLDLTTVSTSLPVLAAQIHPVIITKADIVAKKDDPSKFNLEVHASVQPPFNDKNGVPIEEPITLIQYIGLAPTDKRTQAMIARDIASLLDSVFGEEQRKQINLSQFDLATLVNQPAMVKTAVQAEQNGFPEKGVIQRWVKKGDDTVTA